MATRRVVRRICDVLRRDRQLATANSVRSCTDDWKQVASGSKRRGPIRTAKVINLPRCGGPSRPNASKEAARAKPQGMGQTAGRARFKETDPTHARSRKAG